MIEREKPLIIVVAGPGTLKERLASIIREKLGAGVRVVTDSASMGGEAGVYEELRRGVVRKALREAAIVEAERVIEEFERRLAKEPRRVAYTPPLVARAAEAGAIEELLVLDELLHSPNPEERKLVEEILRLADASRAGIHIVGSETPVAHKLRALGGIIALLRYPLDLKW